MSELCRYPDVMYAPGLGRALTLLSTTKLANAGVGTKSSPQHLDLINIHTSRLMDHAHRVQNLYKLQVDIVCSNELHLTQTHPPAKAPLALWHCQLGHTSEDTILKMVKAKAITGIALNGSGSQNCSACRKGKQMQSIILQVTQERSTKVLGRVFSNICGPIETTSIEGYRYFITFTDDFSHYTHIGLCKSKDDALNIFKMWKACTEKETGQTLKVLHTDGSGKYTSNTFSTYLAEHGIKCELTNAYTPQENSISKWANRTLNNLTHSMIADAKEVLQAKSLPSSLWSQAVHHAAWIKNRIFTHSLNTDITPYQA